MKSQISNIKCQNFKLKLRSFKILLVVLSFAIYVLSFTSTALASTLSLSPATGTFNKNCSFNLDVNLDTQGVGTDGTDAYLNFDSSKFTMNTIDVANKVYPEYPGSGIDPQNPNRILISGLAAQGKPFSGSGKLTTINFTVKEAAQVGATQMTFDFDINNKNSTTDSNVVATSTSQETLSSVNNGSYVVGSGTCGAGASPTPRPAVGGPSGTSTPSATMAPLKLPPPPLIPEKLPEGGTFEMTATVAIVGTILTILGVLGLTLL